MKRLLLIALTSLSIHAIAQTNTFPSSGYVGIGTTIPQVPLHLYSSSQTVQNIEGSSPYIHAGLMFTDATQQTAGKVKQWAIWAGTDGGTWLSGLGFHRYDAVNPCVGGICDISLFLHDNGNVGVGTGAPRQKLEVAGPSLFDSDMFTWENGGIFFSGNGSYSAGIYGRNAGNDLVFNSGGAEKMRISSTGSIGIGISNPQSQLHIGGNTNSQISIGSVSYSGNSGQALAAIQVTQGNADGGIINFQVNPWNQTGSTGIYTPITRMIINQYGNIGIGTTNPAYKLDVLGTIRAKEVLVNLDGGADFVFEKNYKLLPIEHVANYVQENKHLPDIPSANDMGKNGVSMGDMQVKLLQKVEEQTLDIIGLNKEIVEQQKDRKTLEDRLAKQENQYNALMEKVEMLTKQIEKK